MISLNEDESTHIEELLALPTDKLKTFLENIQNYSSESPEKQKYYDSLVKFSLAQRQSKSRSIGLKETVKHDEPNENLDLLLDFVKSSAFDESRKRFTDLEWRLEAKIMSRSSRELSNLESKILLNMKTRTDQQAENIYFEMSPSNLNHVISKLEQALINSKNILGK